MRRGVERYVAEVLKAADLALADEREVREELLDHAADLAAAEGTPLTEQQAYGLLERRFGDAAALGDGIASAKGRLRTYLKKESRRLPAVAFCALILALALRSPALALYRASSDLIEPIVPAAAGMGARLVVSRLWTALGESY